MSHSEVFEFRLSTCPNRRHDRQQGTMANTMAVVAQALIAARTRVARRSATHRGQPIGFTGASVRPTPR